MLPFGTSRRLNSIRWRFALAIAALCFLGMLLRDEALLQLGAGALWRHLSLFVPAGLVGVATFWMASQLTGLLVALRRSTEAIAATGHEMPVDMAYGSELGGLGHSFRKVASRLNANLRRINALAHTDAVTGLPNRSVIEQVLARALVPTRAGEYQAAVLFIGLDGLRRVNDTLGHEAGDELLRQASLRILHQGLHRRPETIDSCLDAAGGLCDRLPADIMLAHFAGEEFVAILPGLNDRTALAVQAECIASALAEPFRLKSQDLRIGASVGIAMAPEDTRNTLDLLLFAAQAMRAAKRAGKLRCAFFDKQSHESVIARARMETELQRALVRHELELHYQPKVNMATRALHGVEALVRWRHPARGLLAPTEFIDAAEQGGLMAILGHQVLEMAVVQCRAWLDLGLPLVVAVNVSPSQFTDPRFVEKVLGALHAEYVPPELLMIEITESLAMTDFEGTARRLGELRAAGVKVAVDDFGIGYSNLSQLSHLPLDVLKIDRSLVQGIGRHSKSEAIICAILGMTRALGCRSIAEGIETVEQYEFLLDHGCDCGQGYLFAKPMPAEAVVGWPGARLLDFASLDVPARLTH